jgi:hypothetical protein
VARTTDNRSEDAGLVSRIGPVEVDWPRTAGYYGGVGLAVGLGLIEAPLGLFIAAVPIVKMLTRPGVARSLRFVGQLIEGAAKPVGGDGDGYVRLVGHPTVGTTDRRRRRVAGSAEAASVNGTAHRRTPARRTSSATGRSRARAGGAPTPRTT